MPEAGTPYFNLEERKDPRGHLITRDQFRWGGLWIGIAVLALLLQPAPLKYLAIPALLIGAVGVWKYEDGIGFRIFQTMVKSLVRRRRAGGRIDISTTKREPLGLRIVGFDTTSSSLDIPEELAAELGEEQLAELKASLEADSFELGTVYSKQDNADTAFVVGTGMDSAQLDSAELFEHRRRVVRAIRNATLASPLLPSYSLIYTTRPINIERHLFWRENNLDPEVLASRVLDVSDEDAFLGATVEERQATALQQMVELAKLTSTDVTMLTAVTLPRPENWPRRRDGSLDGLLTSQQLRDAPIVAVAQRLERELAHAGVTDATALSYDDVGKVTRATWDLKGIRAWYRRETERAAALALYHFGGSSELPEEPSYWPEHEIIASKTTERRDCLAMDGTFHRVLQASRFNKQVVFAEDFLPLFRSRDLQPTAMVGLTVSVCGDIVNVAQEQKALTRKIVFREGWRRNRKGEVYETLADQERSGRLRRKQDAYHMGGAYAFSSNVFVTISATTAELLDKCEKIVQQHASESGIKLRHIKWEERQLRAFMTANLGVSMATQ